ncbi:hypothetical protein [Actinomadura madurae]|nr:hypothetical protein [Actinomadura madurae]MCP9951643.1 hypothetical protein [Actinomadura madurae]MCQ0007614.1 hypothetical protein [Actinomadura madurae]
MPIRWRMTDGPWFDNAIATVELSGRDCTVRWETPKDGGKLTQMGHAGIT